MSHSKMKVLAIFGTRPEAIKMAPLIQRMSKSIVISPFVCVTGQHRQMLDQVLDLFEITPDFDLNIMSAKQDLSDITCNILLGLRDLFAKQSYDAVLVHGDTSTTLAASLAAFYAKIPVFHIEAGLRTGDIFSPWPEELNRNLVSKIACLHFCPTESAKQNLLKEGIHAEKILVTGNTVIDALKNTVQKLSHQPDLKRAFESAFEFIDFDKKVILVTGHRRENFGEGFQNICHALREISQRDDVEIVYPVHLNPAVQEPVNHILGNIANIHLIAPQEYLPFVFLMNKATLVITDSGGIQEEAPALGKPVLVLRNTTERPEAVAQGTAKLVGTNPHHIIRAATTLLDDAQAYQQMAQAQNPYGDGRSAEAIITYIEQWHRP